MQPAPGTFTVWYTNINSATQNAETTKHDVTASNREDLMAKAKEICPEGMAIRAIFWQHGGTSTIWYRMTKKLESECWNERVCQLAFAEA